LELNPDKTLITRARSQPARFLGYDIIVQHCDTRLTKGRRMVNGKVALRVPRDVVKAKCAPYRQHGKLWHRTRLQNLDDYDIVRICGAEYRGVVNYYLLAQDVWRLDALRWHAQTSMLKTLAAKHRSSVTAMATARFGGIPLRQDRRAVITDPAPVPVWPPRRELIYRLRKRWCELCEQGATIAIHQIAALADLARPEQGRPAWAALMARIRRKTLIVCAPCHEHIHATPVADAA